MLWLWLWGLGGAFVYAFPTLILELWADAATKRSRWRAAAMFGAALATGLIFAEGFTSILVSMVAAGISVGGVEFRATLRPQAAALTIGWASNYLWPRILRKLGKHVDDDASPPAAQGSAPL